MKKELEQLSESVFGGLSDSSMPIYKAASGVTWGRLPYYLISSLIESVGPFNMAIMNSAENSGHTYGKLIYKDINPSKSEMNSRHRSRDIEIKKRNTDIVSGNTDDVREHYRRNSARGKSLNKTIRANESVTDAEIAKLMRNTVARIDSITRYARSNMIFRMSENLPEVVLGDVVAAAATTAVTYQNRNTEALLSADNLSIYRNKYSASFEHFSDGIGNISKSEHDDNRTADIGYIEDALARKLHEQIVSGFPMYMR